MIETLFPLMLQFVVSETIIPICPPACGHARVGGGSAISASMTLVMLFASFLAFLPRLVYFNYSSSFKFFFSGN